MTQEISFGSDYPENDCARLIAGTATAEDCDALEAAEMAVERGCPEMLATIARRRAELAQGL